jgi:hypothetical protein
MRNTLPTIKKTVVQLPIQASRTHAGFAHTALTPRAPETCFLTILELQLSSVGNDVSKKACTDVYEKHGSASPSFKNQQRIWPTIKHTTMILAADLINNRLLKCSIVSAAPTTGSKNRKWLAVHA